MVKKKWAGAPFLHKIFCRMVGLKAKIVDSSLEQFQLQAATKGQQLQDHLFMCMFMSNIKKYFWTLVKFCPSGATPLVVTPTWSTQVALPEWSHTSARFDQQLTFAATIKNPNLSWNILVETRKYFFITIQLKKKI